MKKFVMNLFDYILNNQFRFSMWDLVGIGGISTGVTLVLGTAWWTTLVFIVLYFVWYILGQFFGDLIKDSYEKEFAAGPRWTDTTVDR